tara:strand:+ start:17084 stop:17497 length:414 start_codon:yes stop_codon:yes gene_type:complete
MEFSGKTEDLRNESLTEVMAALDILKKEGVILRTTIAASMWPEDDYVMVHNQRDFGAFDCGEFFLNMIKNKEQGDGKLPHPLIPRGTAVVDAFEMDHALRLNFPEEGGVTRFKMLFRRFMCEANDDVDEGKKSEKYN